MQLELELKQPKKRRIIRYLVGLVLLALFIVTSISIFVGIQLTKKERKHIDDNPANYGLPYEEFQIPSQNDGIMLHGWYIPSNSPKMTVIFAHGYGGTRYEKQIGLLSFTKTLNAQNYNVVLFDFRASGESEGDKTTIGQEEKHDLLSVINWVKEKHPKQKIALIGFSMGAATSLVAASESPDVVGVVADSPFFHLGKYLEENLSVWSKLPHYPFTPLMMKLMPWVTGITPETVSPIDAVDHIYPRPILFIHGTNDRSIPDTNSKMMYEKHSDRFQFWNPQGVDHVGAYVSHREVYEEKVLAFLQGLQ